MKQRCKTLCLTLLAAVLLCVPAFAAQFEPAPEPVLPEESRKSIIQSGAFSGPQTLPDQISPIADGWEQEARDFLIAGWEEGWNAIKSEPLDEQKVYILDVTSLNIYLPYETADESLKLIYRTFYDMLSRVINDNPERLFYADTWAFKDVNGTDWTYSYDFDLKAWKIRYVTLYYTPFDGLTGVEAEARFQAAVNEGLALINDRMSDVEKLLVLHDYLVLNCVYNYEVRSDLDAPTGRVYKAYGALVDHEAVCTGYANAYRVFHKRLGFPSLAEGSGAMGHAWNLLQLSDGKWYHADVTWDDLYGEGMCRHNNFLLSDEAFRKTGHHDWSVGGVVYPCDSTKYESGWIFNDSRSSIYHRSGKYYVVKLADSKVTYSVFASDRLDSRGTDLNTAGGDLHLNINHGTVWHDDFLYYIYWDSLTNVRTVAALQLDSGKYVLAGRVEPTIDVTIGLRYENGNIILSNTDTVPLRESYDFGCVPALPNQANAAPPIKNYDDMFPVYYHNGKFYTLSVDRRNGGSKVDLTVSGSLADAGTSPDVKKQFSYIDPGIYGVIWEGDFLYCLYRENAGSSKTLMAVQLDTGKAVQMGVFDKNGSSWVCLRYENGLIIPYDRSSRQAICGGFPVLPAASEITDGIHVFNNGNFAVLQKEPAGGQTLWVAQYSGGQMINLQQGTAAFTVNGHPQPDMTVVPLNRGNSGGTVVKCFLTGPGYAPVCPAAAVAA